MFVWRLDSESGVLPWQKGDFCWRTHANGPQIFGDVSALHDSRAVEFLAGKILLI
jgi:predicted alpha-1,6-mannanase (GH76 family)